MQCWIDLVPLLGGDAQFTQMKIGWLNNTLGENKQSKPQIWSSWNFGINHRASSIQSLLNTVYAFCVYKDVSSALSKTPQYIHSI